MRSPADDPGMASERTALAWVRTGLLFATVGAVALAAAADRGTLVAGGLVAALLVGLGVAVARHGRASYRRRRRERRYAAEAGGALLVAAATLVAACAAVALIVGGA
jgi:uncharacterized membrane protein YidH (DUF202 family)